MKAFPTDRLGVIENSRGISINESQQDGMDLRDYFAAKAMNNLQYLKHPKDLARESYVIADAMMKAREL